MLAIRGPDGRLCDGISRRDFLRIGALGGVGLTLPRLLRAASDNSHDDADRSFGRAKRCVMLFLTGGPPQLDTWDLKPDAPAEIRGELKPIASAVPGIWVSELLPRFARHTDKCSIVRSITHNDTIHTSAGYTMLSGAYHPTPNAGTAKNIRPQPDDHPHIGSILSRLRPSRGGLPTFVSMPETIQDDAVNEYPGQGAGFLGKQFSPFLLQANRQRDDFAVPDVFLPLEIADGRLDERRRLLGELDRSLAASEAANQLAERDALYGRAFDIVRSAAARDAFDLAREPAHVRESYGSHLFGRGCLLARRLVEAGVSLVTVYWHYEGPNDSPVWDTHQNNFPHLRERLMPPTDQALAALVDDLSTRGMLADTLVVCMGEFGRTPRINKFGGRDHWPFVQSIVLAGAGIRAGSTFGASDRIGAYPAERPIAPPDLAATVLHLLGVEPGADLPDRLGRPIRASTGQFVRGLIA